MTVTVSMLWIIGMALSTIAILTVSTLAAAGMLHRPRASDRADQPTEDEAAAVPSSPSLDRAA